MTRHFTLPFIALAAYSIALPALAEQQVSIAPFSELAHARTLQYPATVINLKMADIAAESSGRIIETLVEVGDKVDKGQLLVKLDCATPVISERRAKAGLKRLQAARELTRQQLERAKKLLSARSISQEELDQRQTQLSADRASIEEQQAILAEAQLQVKHCRIEAPFTGTVTAKNAQVGAYATPGLPMLTLLQEDEVEIHLELPPSVIPQLKAARMVQFKTLTRSYPVKVRTVIPRIDPQSLQRMVRLNFAQQERPPGGSYGQVIIQTEKKYLPPHYVQKREGKFGVFVAQMGKAEFRVLSAAQEGQSVAVNFDPGELVITSGLHLLQDQAPIDIER